MAAVNIDIAVENRLQRAAELYQLVVSAWGVMVLVPAGLHRLQAGAALPVILGAAEVIAIALALIAAARQVRPRPEAPPARIDWMNAFVGSVLLLEWGLAVASGHKVWSPTLLGGIATWALAIAQPRQAARQQRRRRLKIDGDGLSLHLSRFHTFHVAWPDVSGVEVTPRAVHFRLKSGKKHTLSLRRFRNREEISAAVAEGAAAAGVETTGTDRRSTSAPR